MKKKKNELHKLIDSINDINFIKRLISLIKAVLGEGD